MKTIKLLSALVIFIFSISNSNAAGLNSVSSKDGSNVWAVGINGYVISSSNGGNTWSNISLGNTTYNSVYSNSQYIWIAGNAGIFQLSTDNGNSWNQQTLGGGVNLRSVFFTNPTTGWIAGDNGTILKSTNSGLNWTTQTSPVSSNLNCIIFTDALNGAACGINGTVLVTTNGGTNWSVSTAPTSKELLSIDMKSGTIIASGADATVIKSTNNGTSWSTIDYKIITKSDINSVFMMDANTYYSCGGGGFIRKSIDAGLTFSFQINPMLADLYKIYFYNNSTGWACGRDNNVVLKTTDGGNTWLMPAGVTQAFSWVRTLTVALFSSSGNVIALNNFNKNEIFISANPTGNSQKVLRSLNLGSNWSEISIIPYGYDTHGFIISPKDSNKFVVLADSSAPGPPPSKILRTTNYGASWITTFFGRTDDDGAPLAYDPNHPDTLYLGATDSMLYRSTDFGLTWQATSPKMFGQFCYVLVPYNNSNIILCAVSGPGDIARTYRSTDFGVNWNIVDSIVHTQEEAPFLANSIFNPNMILCSYLGGTNGGLHKSNNLGANWTQLVTNPAAWSIDFAKDDPNLIVYAQDAIPSLVYISNDNGTNFFTASSINDNTFFVFAYDRKTMLGQSSQGFYKLNITYNNPIGIQPISTEVPKQFSLHQNYPNPFNPETKIKFEIPVVGTVPRTVRLIIYNELGQEVTTLFNEQLRAGIYEVNWNASDYPSGVYFYKLETENFSESKKLILIK